MRIIESNSKKRGGFGLIEVVISMMIMAIISIGVYAGYVLAIKHTKEGQVKQEVTLGGKKVIEEIKSTDVQLPHNPNESKNIGPITITKQGSNEIYNSTRYLDENYKDKDASGNNISENLRKYTEIVAITPTRINSTTEVIKPNTNQASNFTSNDTYYTVYIGKNASEAYITDNINDDTSKMELSGQSEIVISVYIQETSDKNEEKIQITGKNIFKITKYIDKSLVINFSKYKESDGSVPKDVKIEVNVYNQTKDVADIYVQKANNFNAEIKKRRKGDKVNIYDNRAENPAKIENLHDIKLEIRDYKKNRDYEISPDKNKKWEDKDNLFTAYYKQNIEKP